MRRPPSVSPAQTVSVPARLAAALLAVLLAVLLLAPATAADAAPEARDAAVVVLAAEGGGEPVGPEPNPSTTHAPPEYEPPFLINAAVGLTVLLVLGVLGLGVLYWLLVQRPRTRQQV